MTPSFARYDELLHDVYDSAIAPTRWPATLGAIAEVFGARSVALWTFMHGVEHGGICFTHELDQLGFEAFASVSPAEDPFAQALIDRQLLVDGAAYKESDMLPRERVLESRLYRELWSTQGIDQVAVGIVFSGTDGRQLPVAICLYRSALDLPFGDDEVDLLRRLLAHLSRSLGVMFHLRMRPTRSAPAAAHSTVSAQVSCCSTRTAACSSRTRRPSVCWRKAAWFAACRRRPGAALHPLASTASPVPAHPIRCRPSSRKR